MILDTRIKMQNSYCCSAFFVHIECSDVVKMSLYIPVLIGEANKCSPCIQEFIVVKYRWMSMTGGMHYDIF